MNRAEFHAKYGPVALVTGASSGIGKSFADALAALGMDLVIVARRVPRLAMLAADLEGKFGIRVTICPADLSQTAAARLILDATASLDVGLLVSNAGFGLKGDLAAGDPQVMTDLLMVNCHSPMLLAHGFIPRLRARRRGGIIFISSIEALIGCPYSAAYSASKAFVNGLGEGLWGELTPDGLDVLTVCPGATDTEAAALQGIDIATLHDVMPPAEVAKLALQNITNGPVLMTSEHYKRNFDRLLSMPRREALTLMARAMKR